MQGFVQVPSLFYAGSHGFDIWGPTTESMRYQVGGLGVCVCLFLGPNLAGSIAASSRSARAPRST